MMTWVPGQRVMVHYPVGARGTVIRPEESCWERTRYRKTAIVCADPADGHVLVRLDTPDHTIRDWWYRPDDLQEAQ